MPDLWFESMFGGYGKSKVLSTLYKALADLMKVEFLSAGDHIVTDGVDGIHFSAETNITLGHAIAKKAKALF